MKGRLRGGWTAGLVLPRCGGGHLAITSPHGVCFGTADSPARGNYKRTAGKCESSLTWAKGCCTSRPQAFWGADGGIYQYRGPWSHTSCKMSLQLAQLIRKSLRVRAQGVLVLKLCFDFTNHRSLGLCLPCSDWRGIRVKCPSNPFSKVKHNFPEILDNLDSERNVFITVCIQCRFGTTESFNRSF